MITFTLNEMALNLNNCPNNKSRVNKPNCLINTSGGKRVFKLPEAGKRRRGRPIKVKTGLRGRPKILPPGTTEWLRLSQNNDVFCHPTDTSKEKIRLGDALLPSFFRMDTKEANTECKFQITFLYRPACSNGYLDSLALDTESALEPLPQVDTEAEADYSQWKSYQEPDSWIKEVGRMAREDNELLETDLEYYDEGENQDEYGMTDKDEEEFLALVVEAERREKFVISE